MTKLLTDDEFARVIRLAPLVSIDLIIRDAEQKIFVGLRTNEPAKGVYFAPGGRIRKDENIENAFLRILASETGCSTCFNDGKFLGVYEHFYPTNRYGCGDYGTHYIVLAYEVRCDRRPAIELDAQHSDHRWMTEAELVVASDVHEHTKAYFR